MPSPMPPLSAAISSASRKNWRRMLCCRARPALCERRSRACVRARRPALRSSLPARQKQRHHADGAEKILHAIGHRARKLWLPARCPRWGRLLCRWDRSCAGGRGRAGSGICRLRAASTDVGVTSNWSKVMGSARRLGREIAPHGGERNEDFVDVPAVVTGILFLFLPSLR